MKTYILKAALLVIAVLGLQSCDDALDLQPISDIGTDRFYQNAEQLNLAVVGAYSSLHEKQRYEWIVTELRSDNTQLSFDNSQNANVPYRELDRFVSNPLNIYTTNYWRASYKVIGLSNNVLENLGVVTDPALAAQFEGEVRFLRAHSYLNLVRLYGGVFLITRTIPPSEARNLERKSVEEAYQLILDDLQFAYDNLPETYDNANVGRATKWAAGLELGKALLTEGSPANVIRAETILRDVVSLSGKRLLTNYADVFSPNNEMNDEIYFAVRYQSGLVGLGSPFANFFSPLASENSVVTGSGDELNIPTEGMEQIYEANDPRARVNFSTQWTDGRGSVTFERFISKYNSSFANVDDAPNDWIISRHADAMLLLAEAININSGPTMEAQGLLNSVRTRSLSGNTIPVVSMDTFFEFKLVLEEERRREFAFENHRWFDLLRTGRAVVVMNSHFATDFQYNDPTQTFFNTPPIPEFKTLLPIPQYEIDLNPSVAQNIGY